MKILWNKWVAASINNYFLANVSGMEMFIEGAQPPKADQVYGVRINGPHFMECSREYWKVAVEVNILLQVKVTETTLYDMEDALGKITSVFDDIPIYKYGTEVESDGTLFFCLQLLQEESQPIFIRRFGQVSPKVPELQATVSGRYIGHFQE